MANANMPIYRQLFDFLCLASIAISIAKFALALVFNPGNAGIQVLKLFVSNAVADGSMPMTKEKMIAA